MMKNFNSNKQRTLLKEANDNTPFIGIKDLFPDADKRKFEKGDIPVLGYIKVHSKTYENKMNYSLLINYKGKEYFLNVPSWYGDALEADFLESGEAAKTYFGDAFIKEIEEIETKYKNTTFNILVYTEDDEQ